MENRIGLFYARCRVDDPEGSMRIIVACIIVLVTALAAVLLTRIDLLNPPTSVAANAPAPKPAIAPKPAPPADPVSTIANVEPVSPSVA